VTPEISDGDGRRDVDSYSSPVTGRGG
jgi:hypothetical protein